MIRAVVIGLCGVWTAVADYTPKEYTIHLETPPAERWNAPCADHKDVIIHVMNEIEDLMHAVLSEEDYKEAMGAVAAVEPPSPFLQEMEGIARCTGQPLAKVRLANYFYDFVSRNASIACTGIVANYRNDVLHGRNLDFGQAGVLLAPSLRLATVTINYFKAGQKYATYTGFVGLVGAWTGQRHNVFTLEGNERFGSFQDNVEAVKKNWLPPSMLLKQVLINSTSYADAVRILGTTPISSSVYYIVGGTQLNQGVVVTRNTTQAVDNWSVPQAYKWYVAQTNYDHWTQPPANDNRRATAVHAMDEIGTPANLTTSSLYTVMSTPNVLNENTIFTVIMSANQPELYSATVRTEQL
eukprot:TRINITY_DN6485_c0_g1_i1.p1 TRINITY_DN6485_c0_g1~~TRINITY_DN6485_c0_g1_i1.p1  ORF type:complete len:354 (+),score=122.49 TRINITY_DN6485_c0_g1_i1:604-1665(+)